MNAPEHAVTAPPSTTQSTHTLLWVADIIQSPTNPRKHFNEAALNELAESIRAHGVLQPILVRKWQVGMHMPAGKTFGDMSGIHEIVCGERRWRASVIAKAETIPVIVRELSDKEVLEIQVVENLQREDVHPLEEAEGYERLMQHHGYTADTLAAKIGKSRAYVYARLKLTALTPVARTMFYGGKLTASTALLIARVPGTDLQTKAATEITTPDWNGDAPSYRKAFEIIQQNYMLDLDEATFKPGDAKLVTAAGSCTDCPKRSGNDLFLMADIDDANICTDPPCFNNKREVNFLRLKTLAEKSGRKVITGKDAEALVCNGNYSLRNNDYEPLDAKVEHDPQHRTVRELLGKDAKGIVTIEDARHKTLVDAVDSKTLAAAMKKAGIEKPTQQGKFGDDRSADDWDRERAELDAKLASETIWRGKLFQAVRIEIGERLGQWCVIPSSVRDMAELAVSLFEREANCYDLDNVNPLLTLWGHPLPTDESYDDEQITRSFSEHLRTLDAPALYLFLMDIALIEESEVSRYDVGQGIQPTRLLAQAKRLGIDPESLREPPPKPTKTRAKTAAKTATTPSEAAQAGDSSAPDYSQTGPLAFPKPSTPKPKTTKAKSKSNPAPALPANEPTSSAKPVVPMSKLPSGAAWPFPIGART